jgi:uncharacterized membrane protein YqjE
VPKSAAEAPDSKPLSKSFGDLLSQLAHSSAALMRDEIELAKQELRERVRSLRLGLLMLAAGAALVLIAGGALAAALIMALSRFMAPPGAALVVGAILLLLGAASAFVGVKRLDPKKLKPKQTITTLQEDKEWLKGMS